MNTLSMFSVIQQHLHQVEARLLSVIHSDADMANDICCHLVQAGGKRLRPALYLLCAKSGVPDEKADILSVAVAIELIHMATLVHDDVIDNAATRRGIPTANARWGGRNAVLTGDYLFARAFALIARQKLAEVQEILSEVVCTLCEGEFIQAKETFSISQSEADYLRRIDQKTANFIAASCRLGALVAKLSPEMADRLEQYGHLVGMAFQITDDILDITASSKQLGKPAGNDLKQGVVTLPVIYALLNSPCSDELRDMILSRDLSAGRLERCLAIVCDTDAVEYSYHKANQYLLEAKAILPEELDSNIRAALLAVADFIGFRKY